MLRIQVAVALLVTAGMPMALLPVDMPQTRSFGWVALRLPRPLYAQYAVREVLYVKASGYNANDGQEPCHHVGGKYVCGDRVFNGSGAPWVGTIAVSHDLMYLMGKKVRIRGWVYVVRDLMPPTYRKTIDVYFATPQEAVRWGRRSVEMEVLDEVFN